MSCEVGPIGLSTTRMPSRPGPSDERATVSARPRPPRRLASARTAGRAWSTGSCTVAPAARACPPPPNAPVSTVASTPPGLVRTLIRVASPASLNRIATSASSAWASRSMMPSECGGAVPVAARSASSSVDQTTRPSSALSRRSRTRPNRRSCAVGLERYSRREMSESGAPASTRAADTASVRGVAFGWAKVAVSMTMPAIRAAAQRPAAGVERQAEPGRPAARPSRRSPPRRARSSRPRRRASFEAWWSMTTRGSRSNSSRWRSRTSPTRSSVAAIGDDEQVVRRVGVGIGPEPLDAREEVVQRRDRVGADRVGRAAERLDDARRRRGSPRACPRRGSRGRRPARAGRRAAARRRRPAPRRGTAARSTVIGVAGAAWPARPGGCRPLPPRRAAWAGSPPTAAPPARRPRGGRGRPASAASRRAAGRPRGAAPASSSSSSCRTRVPRSAVSSSSTCRSGMRLMRSVLPELVADERHRPAERGDRRRALRRLADDADPHLGMAQVRRRLDLGDRGEPDRGSATSRSRSPISCAAARRPDRPLSSDRLPPQRASCEGATEYRSERTRGA